MVNNEGQVIGKRTGEELYSQSYDPVLKETRDMLHKKKEENRKLQMAGQLKNAGRKVMENKKKSFCLADCTWWCAGGIWRVSS